VVLATLLGSDVRVWLRTNFAHLVGQSCLDEGRPRQG
jgi:hypothetical protein